MLLLADIDKEPYHAFFGAGVAKFKVLKTAGGSFLIAPERKL